MVLISAHWTASNIVTQPPAKTVTATHSRQIYFVLCVVQQQQQLLCRIVTNICQFVVTVTLYATMLVPESFEDAENELLLQKLENSVVPKVHVKKEVQNGGIISDLFD